MSDNSSNNKKIVRNTFFLTIRMVLVLCINLIITRILLKSLGIVDFGIFSVIGGLVSMLTFLNTSMSNGIQRYYNYELGKNGTSGAQHVYNTSIQIQLLLAIVLIIIFETVGLWYLNTKMVIPVERFRTAQWLFQFSIITFLFTVLQVPFIAAIVAHEKMDFYAAVSIIDVLLKLAVSISIAHISCDHLLMYGILMVLVFGVDFFCYFIYSRYKFPEIRLQKYFDRGMFKSMLTFSCWNVFGSFSSMMKDQGINMVINVFFGPVVNAAKGISYQIMGGLNGFSANISMTTRPQIVQSYAQGDVNRTIRLFFISSKLCFLAIYIFALPVLIEIHYILHLWLGNNVPEYTDVFTIWVLLTAFLNNLNGPTSGVVHASGNMKIYQLMNGIISISSVPIAYIAYSNGAPAETSFIIVFLITLICQIISIIILKQIVEFSIRSYLKDVIIKLSLTVICSFVITMIPHLLLHEGIFRLVIVTITALVSEFSCFWIICLEKNQRNSITHYMKNKLNGYNNGETSY